MNKFMSILLLGTSTMLAQNIHICVDSSANSYTLWTQMHECISFNQNVDMILITNRNFLVSNELDASFIPGDLSYINTELVYQQEFGPARYPTAFAGANNLYLSFPYLALGGWRGMAAIRGSWSGGMYPPISLSDSTSAHKVIGKQFPNGRVLFIGLTTNNSIIYQTWDSTLTVFIDSGTIATDAYYWGYDINGGRAYVFYWDTILHYQTTTDGVNWSPQYNWTIPLPGSVTVNFTQMALTDNGKPRLVFDAYDQTDSTYRIYVSHTSGEPPALITVSDTICFYPTIATGGNYCAVLYSRSRNNQFGLPSNWWDFYIAWSQDTGITWTQPVNCTQFLPYNPGLPQLAKRIDTQRMRAYYVYLAHIHNNEDPYWTILFGNPPQSRIYLGCASLSEIEEKQIPHFALQIPHLAVYPNPFNRKTEIRFTIHDPGYRIHDINLKIYDVSGRIVKSFNLESCIMYHESVISWDGTDDSGRRLPPGVYFIYLKIGSLSAIGKIIKLGG